MAVRSESGSSPEADRPTTEPSQGSARQRAMAAWGIDPARPDRCPARCRRPGEFWQCDRPQGHRWRHHYVPC